VACVEPDQGLRGVVVLTRDLPEGVALVAVGNLCEHTSGDSVEVHLVERAERKLVCKVSIYVGDTLDDLAMLRDSACSGRLHRHDAPEPGVPHLEAPQVQIAAVESWLHANDVPVVSYLARPRGVQAKTPPAELLHGCAGGDAGQVNQC